MNPCSVSELARRPEIVPPIGLNQALETVVCDSNGRPEELRLQPTPEDHHDCEEICPDPTSTETEMLMLAPGATTRRFPLECLCCCVLSEHNGLLLLVEDLSSAHDQPLSPTQLGIRRWSTPVDIFTAAVCLVGTAIPSLWVETTNRTPFRSSDVGSEWACRSRAQPILSSSVS
ncbi:hypothetical protein DAPPUDRAFT_231944 [Daphnia pulex]|uniref:Uncharacterized protein n=1 Tax=Daphnia pulex TaxID=6669 RepID=E9FRK6_DAPPU|nr:hypothetical protein DAPPUDRAFT_231944 [Daphnia pulex]|eukprot:EFX90461.1 hypothetical protein DAPPUDRAFT_231944 [Daphnia pulex]